MSINECLRAEIGINQAIVELAKKGLSEHPTCPAKSWDLEKAIKFISQRSKGKDAHILDLGCGLPSELLIRLKELGYRKLFGCDLRLITGLRSLLKFIYFNFIFGLRISKGNIESTRYKEGQFDFLVSLSVLEHGINLASFFSEALRILKTGGHLIISCDYWPVRDMESGETDSFDRHSGKAKYFIKSDIEEMIAMAGEKGLFLAEPIDFSVQDRLVNFSGNTYTFIFFILQKLKDI